MCNLKQPPILRNKNYKRPSIFAPENLLREAKRQKNIVDHKVPRICLLDPDGDIVQNLLAEKIGSINPYCKNLDDLEFVMTCGFLWIIRIWVMK